MSDLLLMLFVFLVTPIAFFATIAYSIAKQELYLGAFASFGLLILSGGIVRNIIDQDLWSLNWVYMAEALFSALMLVGAVVSTIVRVGAKLIASRQRKEG